MIPSKKSVLRKMRRRLSAEPLEARRLLAASLGWDGPGLGSAELTYTISGSPSSLSQAEVDAAISTALEAWSAVSDISFTKTEQTGLRDSIDLSFVRLDGSGGTLAQAYFPDDVNPGRIAGDIQFDLDEVWEVGNELGNRAFDLAWVAAHEIGHALGVDHSGQAGSILHASVSPNQSFVSLDSSDVAEIQSLYAAATESITTESIASDVVETSGDPNATGLPADQGQPTVGDDTGQSERHGRNDRFGGGFGWRHRLDADGPQFHNLYDPTDTNEDGSTSLMDALMVINRLGQEGQSGTGLCDVNNDGDVSVVDALMIINALGESEQAADSSDPVETSSGEVATDPEVEGNVSDEDNASDEVPVEDLETGTAETGTDETETAETGTAETGTDETETAEGADEEREIDDGGVIDDGDGNCEHGHHHGRHVLFPAGLMRDSGERLLAAFDEDESGALTEDEVSRRLWNKISAADTDQDQAISLEELQAWRGNRDTEMGQSDGNGIDQRVVDHMFAQMGRRIRFARRSF